MSVQFPIDCTQPMVKLNLEPEGKFAMTETDRKVSSIAAGSTRPPMPTIVSQWQRPPKERVVELHDSSASEAEFDTPSRDESDSEADLHTAEECSDTVRALTEFSLSEAVPVTPAAPRLRAKAHPDTSCLDLEPRPCIQTMRDVVIHSAKTLKRLREPG